MTTVYVNSLLLLLLLLLTCYYYYYNYYYYYYYYNFEVVVVLMLPYPATLVHVYNKINTIIIRDLCADQMFHNGM